MQLEINLSEQEQEALVQRARAAGKDVQTYLQDLVQTELQEDADVVATSEVSSDQWRQNLRECIALHPLVRHVDDSRESIYDDRGR
jgi:hypothetical protein